MTEIANRISIDPAIRFGKPIITGTRVPVEVLVAKVATGMSIDDVAREYDLQREDVMAALHYAARIISNERILPTN